MSCYVCSRSAEIALAIFQKKDLGCKSARQVQTIEEEKCIVVSRAIKSFWGHLGCTVLNDLPAASAPGPPEEDEEFESEINDLNLIWEVKLENGVEELVPLNEHWGCIPKHEALHPEKVLVIDFGTEVYVWNGKSASFELRRSGVNLAKKVWEEGFDYTSANKPHRLLGTKELQGQRPYWCLLGKVNQHMETMLFREKFAEWPDATKVIKVKDEEERMSNALATNTGEIDFEAFDAEEMMRWKIEDPNLELEGSCLGRGRGHYDEVERRQYEIETLALKSWHISEYDIEELADNWTGQFHDKDTYVFRWTYKVSLTGRDLKGRPSKHAAVGRERFAYFFWQGDGSKTTEKGTSALKTIELDREQGPQILVHQGREDAAFLSLFGGKMAVHFGSRSGRGVTRGWRMYIIRGKAF